MSEKKNAKFATKWGFILASVGSAVGMANVWGFPAKMGSYGGSAFLIAYLIFVALFGIVGLSAEYAIGRRARTGTLGSYQNAWATCGEKAGRAGGILGWLPLAGSMCIAIGYAIIVAYVLKAFFHSVTGELMHTDAAAWFDALSSTDFSKLEQLLAQRAEARANKNWAESDRLRDLIISMGYTLKDTKQGQQVTKNI